MNTDKTILVIGTFDTKRDELDYIRSVIVARGGRVLAMDVSILGDTDADVGVTKHEVATAAGSSIRDIVALGDENRAMSAMARGAARLAATLHQAGRFDGMLALGGTMGTDLALDVALVLPLGLPKYIASTVAFSPLIPPERLAPDLQMILWAGGLFGLNAICRSALSQAAGAVLGAAQSAVQPRPTRPMIGVTSLGNAALSYMLLLKPALEARGYEAAIFHSSGMGGRAFETLAAKGMFAAVMDFCVQEFNNGIHGSVINSGPDRLRSAGRAGIPQIVAPGTADLVDLPAWQDVPARFEGRPCHVHNKLIMSVVINAEERRASARALAECLNAATAPTHLILPLGGIEEWDRPGEVGHQPADLKTFFGALRSAVRPPVTVSETTAHINDPDFVDAALEVFDDWVAKGIIAPGLARAGNDAAARG